MTALSDALILAIHRLETVQSDLQVLLTLVDAGGVAQSEMMAAAPATRPAGITGHEHQVLVLLGRGLSNKEIAEQLGHGVQNIKNTLSTVYRKLHVQDRTQAAVLAHELGLVSDLVLTLPQLIERLPHLSAADLKIGPRSRLGINHDVPRPRNQRST